MIAVIRVVPLTQFMIVPHPTWMAMADLPVLTIKMHESPKLTYSTEVYGTEYSSY